MAATLATSILPASGLPARAFSATAQSMAVTIWSARLSDMSTPGGGRSKSRTIGPVATTR